MVRRHPQRDVGQRHGFYFARQSGGLAAQLGRGVRAFLLDLHYGGQIEDIVRTDFLSPADKAESDQQLTPKARLVLDRFLALAGADIDPKDRKVYLCHLYCELGATLAKDAFSFLHQYLRVNRNEVVILVLEDHVLPEDAVAVLEASHLADRAYTWVPGTPPPTLREMIRTKKNVLIMAEHHGGVRPWYQAGYDRILQDTPLPVRLADRARGPRLVRAVAGPGQRALLLVNHWLDTGLPRPERRRPGQLARGPRRPGRHLRAAPEAPADHPGCRLLLPGRPHRRRSIA